MSRPAPFVRGLKGWGALALMAWLGSCSFMAQENKIHQQGADTEQLMKAQELHAQSPSMIKTPKPRIAGERVRLRTSENPETLEESIRFVTKGNESLSAVLEDLSRLIGIPIKTSEINASWGSVASSQRLYPSGINPVASSNGVSAGEVNASGINLDYQGTVKALLDLLAAKANVSWRFNSQTQGIEYFRFETKTFSVFLPPGVRSLSAGISLAGVNGAGSSAVSSSSAQGLGSSPSGSGAGQVSVSQSQTINPWGSIMEGVRAILSEGQGSTGLNGGWSGGGLSYGSAGSSGASLSSASPANLGAMGGTLGTLGSLGSNASNVSWGPSAIAHPELGMITVTAKPLTLERVQRYISSVNERFAHNVMIDVKIFSVALDEQNSLGFGLNSVYTSLTQVGARISTPNPLQAGVDAPGILTLTPPTGSSRWSGSSLVVQALSQWGKVALQRQGQVLAVNGQPSPIQVANEISYVSSSTTTNSPNVGSSVTQNTGSKVVGFTANFLPLILGDNRILLSYQMQISSLASPLTPNAQGIQTPNIASQSLQQQAFVQDGQAIVLFGYDEKRDGVDSAYNIAGYSKSNSQSRQMMVIVLQINTGGVFHEM
jgi:Bacterial type II and III secretion system protein